MHAEAREPIYCEQSYNPNTKSYLLLTSSMAHSPASTNPTFFEKYNFDFDPHVSLYAEFLRLAESRQWKQGSKSKAFEQAWYTCSGSDVPVGCNVDKEAGQVGAQRTTDDEVFSSILLGLENLELATRATKKGMKCKDVGREFAMHYGADASLKERWQALCRDCGVNPPPSSITKCKKVQPLPIIC